MDSERYGSGSDRRSPLTVAERILVRGGRQVPAPGYWVDPATGRVRYLHPGQVAPEGEWLFVTSAFNLGRPHLRALVEQLGLFVGQVGELDFD